MKTEQRSISEIRMEEERRLMAYYHMSKSSPIQRAEAIAKHYVVHANLAMNLLKLLEMARHHGCPGDSMYAAKMMVDQITSDHMHDFGIKLEWPLPENTLSNESA